MPTVALSILTWAAITAASPSPRPEPPLPFGRVVYRAARVASLESLGITMIACRHRDPVARRFALEFFDRAGAPVVALGLLAAPPPPAPAGKKILFVTEGTPFKGRDVLNLHLGHLGIGTARVISDAEIVHCVGKMRMDPGARRPSYPDEIGLVRAGEPLPVLPTVWKAPPDATRRP